MNIENGTVDDLLLKLKLRPKRHWMPEDSVRQSHPDSVDQALEQGLVLRDELTQTNSMSGTREPYARIPMIALSVRGEQRIRSLMGLA